MYTEVPTLVLETKYLPILSYNPLICCDFLKYSLFYINPKQRLVVADPKAAKVG